MTPKEKAMELVKNFFNLDNEDIEISKLCALIAVDEIMRALTVIPYGMQYLSAIDYWLEVKQEIEKLLKNKL